MAALPGAQVTPEASVSSVPHIDGLSTSTLAIIAAALIIGCIVIVTAVTLCIQYISSRSARQPPQRSFADSEIAHRGDGHGTTSVHPYLKPLGLFAAPSPLHTSDLKAHFLELEDETLSSPSTPSPSPEHRRNSAVETIHPNATGELLGSFSDGAFIESKNLVDAKAQERLAKRMRAAWILQLQHPYISQYDLIRGRGRGHT